MAKKSKKKVKQEEPVTNEHPLYSKFAASKYMKLMDMLGDIEYIWTQDRFENEISIAGEDAKKIETDDIKELVNLLRKEQLEVYLWLQVIKKLLENEAVAKEEILKKVLTNRQDRFLAGALAFLLLMEENPSEWIMANYHDIAAEPAKAHMCLALGVRGGMKYQDFLMEEAERMLFGCPDEDFYEAAMIAALGMKE